MDNLEQRETMINIQTQLEQNISDELKILFHDKKDKRLTLTNIYQLVNKFANINILKDWQIRKIIQMFFFITVEALALEIILNIKGIGKFFIEKTRKTKLKTIKNIKYKISDDLKKIIKEKQE